MAAKGYSEKQLGVMFFTFGMSQFLFQAPAGYLYDYTENKVLWLSAAGTLTTLLTVFTAAFASDNNFWLMVVVKFLQGAITSFIPPGLNSITQGIVGTVGMTAQVSINEMMNHLGTAIIVVIGSLTAYALYPNIGMLFTVSPIACAGFLYWINQIKPGDIDHNAARGLTTETTDDSAQPIKDINDKPSFALGMGGGSDTSTDSLKANTPLQVLRDPILLIFILVCFLFHTSNGTVLPLVMQTLAIGNGGTGVLMSGLCITIAQVFMVMSAKICGDYSGKYGRKWLFLAGLTSVPIRCAMLSGLLAIRGDAPASPFLNIVILSTQILDGVGAGVFGTMYILVTSDISGGTGRFGLTLGLTTAAMSIGGTVSGYLGQSLAQDKGYLAAFVILMFMSMIPAALYLVLMPETLPDTSRTNGIETIREEGPEAGESSALAPKAGAGGNYVEMT